jgi:acyl-CoA synthetase (NDP forming)
MTFEIDPSLKPFFSPRGVAIVGASQKPTKLGYGLCRNLAQSGYQGAIHFVNIKGGSLLGHAVHTSIAAVPDPVDLAVLLIPAPTVPAAIRECGQRGIRVLTLYLEGVSDGRRFVEEAEKVTCHKLVIALKVGLFESGQHAVASRWR